MMKILVQDRDYTYNFNRFFACIAAQDVWHEGNYFGCNVMGFNYLGNSTLLGTYDTTVEAEQIVTEIYKLYKAGCKSYTMPDASMELDELAEGENMND